MAAARFGAETAARMSDVLAPIADPERLAGIGHCPVRCDTGAEFLARLGPSSPPDPGRRACVKLRIDIGDKAGGPPVATSCASQTARLAHVSVFDGLRCRCSPSSPSG